MPSKLVISALAGAAVLGLAVNVGLSDASASATAPTAVQAAAAKAAALTDCPVSPPPVDPPPPGAITVAKTITPVDTTGSIVLHPSGPQIQCGRTPVSTYSDVTYSTPTTAGQQISLKMDVQVPQTAGPKPVVVYITGGGFISADKTGNLAQRTYLAEQGYVVASIEYRTEVIGATYRDGVADVKSAVRYLRAHAAQYGIDSSKVAVWGQSAGGYLAAMAGTTNGLKQFDVGDNLGQSSSVQAVVDEFGVADLAKTAADYDVATQQAYAAPGNFINAYVFGPGSPESVTTNPAADAAASPVTYISRSTTVPFVLLQGSQDHIISPSQSLLMLKDLRAKGIDATRYVLWGADHGDLSFMGGDPATGLPWSTVETMGKITGFLGQQLGC